LLQSKVSDEVKLIILNKRNSTDFNAFLKLLQIVHKNRIRIVHAHSTSVVWATIVKFFVREVRIVWHDHYGDSEHLNGRSHRVLSFLSRQWSFIIPVNEKLRQWSIDKLHFAVNRIKFVNNFVTQQTQFRSIDEMEMIIYENMINIICVANLRPQKDHINLLDAFEKARSQNDFIKLYMVGVNPGNEYAKGIIQRINDSKWRNDISYLGAQEDVGSCLRYMHIGVLSSKSEGLPVALLEYGAAHLSIAATGVGQVSSVMADGAHGLLVPAGNSLRLAEAILEIINQPEKAKERAEKFAKYIDEEHSEKYFANEISSIYSLVLNNKY